ncbi:MAG: FliH/SctL family protein [Lachnospiraceae bacterium]
MSKVLKTNEEQKCVEPYQFFVDFQSLDGEDDATKPEETTPEDKAHADRRMVRTYTNADETVAEALEQAQVILEAARTQAEEIKNDGFEAGRKEGYEEGYEEGFRKAYDDHTEQLYQEAKRFEDELISFVEQMQVKKTQVLDNYIDDLKKIALAVAEKIIKTSLRSSGEIIKRMIISATDKLEKSSWAKIYITANDAGRMMKGDTDLVNELSHISDNIKIVVMDTEEEGNCIVELPEEIIDVSVNTQLQNIKDILNNARV